MASEAIVRPTDIDDIVKFLVRDAYESAHKNRTTSNQCEAIGNLNRLEQNFSAALLIMQTFEDSESDTAEFVVLDYVECSKKINGLFATIFLPPPSVILEFAKLCICRPVACHTLLDEFSRMGLHGPTSQLAKAMDRKLNRSQIRNLVASYNSSGSRSDETEKTLIKIARESLFHSEVQEITESIRRRREEFDTHCD